MSIHNSISLVMLLLLSGCAAREQFYTVEDFGSVRKVDTHVHPNTENTALVEQAKKDNFIILAVNVDAPHYPTLDEQQRLALKQVEASEGHAEFLSTISMKGWETPGWAQETIRRLADSFDKGALGIKVWKNIGMVEKDSAGNFIMIDDPAFDPVIEFLKEQNKTLMAHLGEPRNCWLPIDSMTVNNDRNYYRNHPEYHMYLHPENPSYETLIAARDRFVGKHPDLRFVGAHLGSLEWSVDELARRLDKYPNMAVDMAARISHLQHQSRKDREKVRDFIIKYKDRLIYATDAGMSADSNPEAARKSLHERWLADWRYFTTDDELTSPQVNGAFRGLKLPRDVVDHIYFKSAVHWFNIDTKSKG